MRNRKDMRSEGVAPGMKKVFIVSAVLGLVGIVFLPAPGAQIPNPSKNVFIGSLEDRGWCGLVLAPSKDSAFAFRFKVEKEGQIADGSDLYYMVSEVGPHAPDGLYARIKFDLGLPILPADRKRETPVLIKPAKKSDTLTLEWSRLDERTVIGRIQIPAKVRLHLFQYFPWDFKGRCRLLPDGLIHAESRALKPYHCLLWTNRRYETLSSSNGEDLTLSYSPEERFLYFVAGVGDDREEVRKRIAGYQRTKAIASLIEEESDRYQKKRVRVDGLYQGVPEALTNNIFWTILYQPGFHRLYTPAGRRWIFDRQDGSPDHWQIFAWDSFFNALEVAVESPDIAADVVRAVLETQYPNGNIPNWRSRFGGTPDRSQPPVGAYVVLKLFQRTGDMDLLNFAYPLLKKWHAFWKAKKPNGQARRDGNGDGLLEWGSDKDLVSDKSPAWEVNAAGEQRARWESGQDDLPNWDDVPFSAESGTLTMNCLDLNSLYALDAWSLSQIADILDKPQDNESYLGEYERIKELINTILWNPREGFYFDRHWDGRFSTRKAASNFIPLLARIPDERRAQLMVRHLLNTKEFWGDYVIPTISRDDPAFNDPKNPERQYWRGTIWPPTNYLVYQGLKAYGLDAVASEFARKSAQLFMRSWTNLQLCPENFHPLKGEAGGQRYQSWGPLFALIALEEYLDFTPWEGFRFGMVEPEASGTLRRISIQGRSYDLKVTKKETLLREEGREIFAVNGGTVIRHFLYSDNEIRFEIKSIKNREVRIHFLKKGKYQLLIDNQPQRIFRGKAVAFNVPPGDHTALIQLLEDLD